MAWAPSARTHLADALVRPCAPQKLRKSSKAGESRLAVVKLFEAIASLLIIDSDAPPQIDVFPIEHCSWFGE